MWRNIPKHKKVTDNVDKWWRERREISQTIPKYLMGVASHNKNSKVTSSDFQAIYQKERLNSQAIENPPSSKSHTQTSSFYNQRSEVVQSRAHAPKVRSEEKSAGQPMHNMTSRPKADLAQVHPNNCQMCQAFERFSPENCGLCQDFQRMSQS